VLLFLIELQGENATEISMIEKLALYIWDNYVDFHETLDKVVFMGIGTAMHFVHAILGRRRKGSGIFNVSGLC
jgi:hypothetical protein